MALRYGSVCSGIEAATVAWHPLGWQPQFFSEIDAAPRAVLSHHYPGVPLHGDFTTIQDGQYGAIDLLVGGTPCQSFSVAGLRGGLADDRGNLALQYLRLAQRLRPRWLVWENVPGVLSSNGGRDFGAILGGMGELGYGVAYRVLDALDFGAGCPRPRVFVVGYCGDWRPPATVLFERSSFIGHRRPREAAAPVFTATGAVAKDDRTPCILEERGPRIATPLEWERALGFPDGYTAVPFVRELRRKPRAGQTEAGQASEARAAGLVPELLSEACPNGAERSGDLADKEELEPLDAVQPRASGRGGDGRRASGSLRDLLGGSDGALPHRSLPLDGQSARHPLPRLQCETTDSGRREAAGSGPSVPRSVKILSDGPRYKALGNSMAVNAMRWIGRRIEAVEAISSQARRQAA